MDPTQAKKYDRQAVFEVRADAPSARASREVSAVLLGTLVARCLFFILVDRTVLTNTLSCRCPRSLRWHWMSTLPGMKRFFKLGTPSPMNASSSTLQDQMMATAIAFLV